MYFTYIHIIFIVLLFIFFALLGFLFLRNATEIKKVIITVSMLFVGFLGSSAIACLIIDDYTKVARISEVQYNRVILNESLNFTGIITNVGGFDITSCTINVRITNSPSKLAALSPDLFVQKDWSFWDIFKIKKKEFKISTINQDFTIGERLLAHSARPFSLYVRYPTTFVDPKVNYTLTCH